MSCGLIFTPRKRVANQEIRLHCAALQYLRVTCPNCLVFHVPNGGARTAATGKMLKAMGLHPGVFDLTVIGPDGQHYYLEAKTAKGRLSPAQEAFKFELIRRGVPYVIFRNLGDVEAFIRQYKIPTRLAA